MSQGGAGRARMTIASFLVVYLGVFIVTLLLPFEAFGRIAAFLCAAAAAGYTWTHPERFTRGVAGLAARGAALCGAVGFVGGFVGPLIFAPDANQGPLLGLFITGPGGVVLGALAGALWGITHPAADARD